LPPQAVAPDTLVLRSLAPAGPLAIHLLAVTLHPRHRVNTKS